MNTLESLSSSSAAVDDDDDDDAFANDGLSDSGEMELDVEGVWLTGDFYPEDKDLFLDDKEEEEDDELTHIFDVSWVEKELETQNGFLTFPGRSHHRALASSQSTRQPRTKSCDRVDK